MRKLIRPQDMLLLGLANLLDVFEEIKDPMGIIGKSYENMYGFVPSRYKKNNFNNLVWRSLKTGYIEKVIKDGTPYLRLTSQGLKRAERYFPLFKIQKNKWDCKWRMVVFDIEETNKQTRERLRGKLKELGFGMLQKSIFITPNDIAKDFSEFVEEQGLKDFVYVVEVSEIAGGDIKNLARKVWKLNEINEDYLNILDKINKLNYLTTDSDRIAKFNSVRRRDEEKILNFIRDIRKKYLEVLLKDPFLPKELLPDNWAGDEAKIKVQKLEKSFNFDVRSLNAV